MKSRDYALEGSSVLGASAHVGNVNALGFATSGRILVVGDVMLDRYVHGQVIRISPEAPVPVLRGSRVASVAGGAANVAANIAALGGEVCVASIVGDDEAAKTLATELAGLGARLHTAFGVEPERHTTLKTRFVTNNQQLLRLDQEHTDDVSASSANWLIAAVRDRLPRVSTVVLSDYGKGVLTPATLAGIFALCRSADIPVVLDPKRSDWAVYRGATVITPNRAELSAATGMPCDSDAEAAKAATMASDRFDTAVLLTRSEQGMLLARAGEPPLLIPTEAREVSDVSGAGDTVVGLVALGLAGGLTLPQAMRIANVAAGLVVAKRGTATVTPDELSQALRRVGPRNAGVTSPQGVGALRALWREQGFRVGFTNGCFDIIHPGHIRLLQEAAAHCDRLIVAINSDASVRRLKGWSRPIQDQISRATVLGAMQCVDAVIVFDDDTPFELISKLRPDVLVKGADYQEGEVVGADLVKADGGRLVLVPLEDNQSTTSILVRSQDRMVLRPQVIPADQQLPRVLDAATEGGSRD